MTLARYIRPSEAGAYRAAGWTVVTLLCHHGAHAMLATKKETTNDDHG